MATSSVALSLFLCFFSLFHHLSAQQAYLGEKQHDCYRNISSSLGYLCNGPSRQKSCTSFLIFKSLYPYVTAVSIGYLLNSKPRDIAQINGISKVTDKIPNDTQVLVRVNCSCSGHFYQHNASYTINLDDTYYITAYNPYQGMTTCEALINQNPYGSTNLEPGMEILVPLRCACPTGNQIRNGMRFLLTYPTDKHDNVAKLSESFGVDEQDILYANMLSSRNAIVPSTSLLIPLKTEPHAKIPTQNPDLESPQPINSSSDSNSQRKWVGIGIGFGIGVGFILVLTLCLCFSLWHRQRHLQRQNDGRFGKSVVNRVSEGARNVIESLTVYEMKDLQKATRHFSEDCRIKGSVYHGLINGVSVAVKRIQGDVSDEINILNQISHVNVIRLSGFCLHEGNTYLIYEFAENGSLSEWLHEKNEYGNSSTLTWNQRVQIAYNVASGLHYLHNYANPPFIHKDLKSSNVLLDGNLRAKVANFGLARRVAEEEENEESTGLQMTRHVVGTQGYMAPEYLEHGLITPKLDVFAMGVILLELLSGREAVTASSGEEMGGRLLLWASGKTVLEGNDNLGKLKSFIDPRLQKSYPLHLAFSMVQLAVNCVDNDLNSRPTMMEVFATLSKILSSSLEWDASGVDESNSLLVVGR